MFRRYLLIVAAIVASAAVDAKPPKKPPAPPATLAACEGCHGATGVSSNPSIPHLNGQLPETMIESFDQFMNGKRPSSTPEHSKPELTLKEITALSNYYAWQKAAERPAQVTDPAKVAAAGPVYTRRCAKCHLDNGRDSDHDAPLMAGQYLDYLQTQTTAFVKGDRRFPFLMDEAYQGLGKEDLENLSHYFASQPPQ